VVEWTPFDLWSVPPWFSFSTENCQDALHFTSVHVASPEFSSWHPRISFRIEDRQKAFRITPFHIRCRSFLAVPRSTTSPAKTLKLISLHLLSATDLFGLKGAHSRQLESGCDAWSPPSCPTVVSLSLCTRKIWRPKNDRSGRNQWRRINQDGLFSDWRGNEWRAESHFNTESCFGQSSEKAIESDHSQMREFC
jgi:hypothetical protein